jgi:hypothetical protein
VAHPAGGGVAASGFFARDAWPPRRAWRSGSRERRPALAPFVGRPAGLRLGFAREALIIGSAFAVVFGAALGAALAVAFGAALGAALAVAFGPALPLAFARADGALADDFAFAAVFALGEAFFARGFAVSAGGRCCGDRVGRLGGGGGVAAGLPRLALRRVGRDRGRLERTSRWGSSAIGPSILSHDAAQGLPDRCVD